MIDKMNSHIARCYGTVLFLLLFNGAVYGQSLRFYQYTVEDGLPSSTVYQLTQDQQGLMWFGTEAGLCSFNGYEFTSYTIEDGLPDNDVLRVMEDASGRIWVITLKGIACLDHGRFRIAEAIPENVLVYSITQDRKKNIYASAFDNRGSYVFKEEKGSWRIHFKGLRVKNLQARGGRLYFSEDIPGPNSIICSIPVNGKVEKRIECISSSSTMPNFIHSDYYGIVYNAAMSAVYAVKDGKTKKLIGADEGIFAAHSLRTIYEDRDHHLWLATSNGVFRFSPEGFKTKQYDYYLPGVDVISPMEDQEGNMWFTTFGKGVYFLPEKATYCKNIGLRDGLVSQNVTAIESSQDGLVIAGFNNNKLAFVEETSIKPILLNPPRSYSRVKAIRQINTHRFLVGTDVGMNLIDRWGHVKQVTGKMAIKSLYVDDKESVWVGWSKGMGKLEMVAQSDFWNESSISAGENYPFRFEEATDIRTTAFCEGIEKDTLWFGSNRGLFYKVADSVAYAGDLHPLLSSSISDIQPGPDRTLWIGTYGNGLVIKKGNRFMELKEQNGLSNNMCNKIYFDRQGIAWIATNKGVSMIRSVDFEHHTFDATYFDARDGLVSDEVRDLTKVGEKVWMATAKGISVLDEAFTTSEKQKLPIYISSIKINEKEVTLKDSLYLDYRQNNVKFQFTGVSFAAMGVLNYKYRLLGLDKDWIYSQQRIAQYPYLEPKNYLFEVAVQDKNGTWSEAPVSVYLSIRPHFTQTLLFKLFIALSFVLVVLAVYYIRMYRLKEKERLKAALNKKVADIEQQALRAQMNPHFMFNSLNAIQKYILKNEPDCAQKYLTKFSRLMRMVLENSRNTAIPLSQEIDTLSLYMDMERMRFNEKFDYSFNIAPGIDTYAVQVPPMLIQPFIENAVRHGIRPLSRKGSIQVGFKMNENTLLCSIEDDGIGISASKELKSRHHVEYQSRGMSLSLDWLKAIGRLVDVNVSYDIEELYHDDRRVKGTRISLRIPLVQKGKIVQTG